MGQRSLGDVNHLGAGISGSNKGQTVSCGLYLCRLIYRLFPDPGLDYRQPLSFRGRTHYRPHVSTDDLFYDHRPGDVCQQSKRAYPGRLSDRVDGDDLTVAGSG